MLASQFPTKCEMHFFSKFKLTGMLERSDVPLCFLFKFVSQACIVNSGPSGSICIVYQTVFTSEIYL